MKQAAICKAAEGGDTARQLALINRHCRRELSADEVYIFGMVLCDNQIDRDYERFTAPALHKLAKLFEGKTGIFDHNPKGENQTARIFETAVETDPDRTGENSEPYHCLRAWAYMVRCDKNRDLILEIDAGIKKEVSIGCSMGSVTCSVCGADRRGGGCGHIPGKSYKGAVCHAILDDPTDAYEWSFVAVPAQPGAGVTKARRHSPPDGGTQDPARILKLLGGGDGLTLSAAQCAALLGHIAGLEQLAQMGKSYLSDLRRETLRLGLLAQPGFDPAVLERALAGLEAEELTSMQKAFAQGADRLLPPKVQLAAPAAEPAPACNPFKI